MLIILLNFLIAVISQSYEKVKNSAMMLEYQDKCQLNSEAHMIMELFKYNITYKVMIITEPENVKDKQETEDFDEWTGFVQTLKMFIKKKSRKISNDMTKLEKTMKQIHDHMDKE